jgi:argininosuccinate synthase
VRLKFYKGNVIVVGRQSDNSLFSEKIATFEDDEGAYDQKDAAGFIKQLVTFHALAQTKNRYKPYWHILASVHL